jgi:hypothetical protein
MGHPTATSQRVWQAHSTDKRHAFGQTGSNLKFLRSGSTTMAPNRILIRKSFIYNVASRLIEPMQVEVSSTTAPGMGLEGFWKPRWGANPSQLASWSA